MKLLVKYLTIIFTISVFCISPKQAEAQGGVSFQVFYDNLAPYGQWVNYPDYGFVWVPMAGPDFFPYSSNGHWVYTNFGWTWVSHYKWGWAPFHYGRWSYDDYYGWFWIPDNYWGPAWVTWRTSPDYYGWAPLGPNITINIVIGEGYHVPHHHWVFLPHHYMGRDDIHHYYGHRNNNQQYLDNSTVINNTYVDRKSQTTYIAGPEKDDVQRATGSPVKPVEIKENSKPGQSLEKNRLNIYRPEISTSANKDARPSKIAEKKDVKQISERSVINEKGIEEPQQKRTEEKDLQKIPVNSKTNQEKIQQKQPSTNNKSDKHEPTPQKKQPNVTPQTEKPSPKPTQIDPKQKQNIQDNKTEKQVPVQQKKQPVNTRQPENQKQIQKEKPTPERKQQSPTPRTAPIKKDRQQRQKVSGDIEPETYIEPQVISTPGE